MVTTVSADLTREQQANAAGPVTQQAYYVVRISLPEKEVKRLGDLQLVPGMQVEAYIRTHDRTPLEYLLKPLARADRAHIPRALIVTALTWRSSPKIRKH